MPIQFPQRDLTNQFISLSYQDVVQRYNSGSLQYFLDGLGFSIAYLPSASLGNQLLTSDQTASYSLFAVSASFAPGSPATTASYALTAVSASYANKSTLSDVASVADVALLADTASVAANADSASYSLHADTASFALNSSGGSNLITGSLVPITSSQATSASFAPQQQNISINSITTSFFSGSGEVIVPNPLNPQDAATKGYVDSLAINGLDLFFRSSSMDVNGYFPLLSLDFPLSASNKTISTSSITLNERFLSFNSLPIGVTSIQQGNVDVRWRMRRSSGGATNIAVAPELYLRTGSVENLLGTDSSFTLNTTDTNYVSVITITSSFNVDPNDTIVVKFNATSVNASPSIVMTVDGQTSTGISVDVPSSNYVLKSGDTMTGNLTAPGFTGSLFGTASQAVSASFSQTASFALNSSGGSNLITGSLVPITSSQSITASFAQNFVRELTTASLYPITSSQSVSSSYGLSGSYAVTSSWAVTASFAQTASVSFFNFTNINILNTTQSIFATQSLVSTVATSSLFASSSLSSSWATSSYTSSFLTLGTYFITASQATSASWAPDDGDNLITGSLIPITASQAITASYSATSSVVNGFTFDNVVSTISTTGSNQVLFQRVTGSFGTAFFDYQLSSGSNQRAGLMFGTWNNNSIFYTEQTTIDIGDTSQVSMSMALSNSFVQFLGFSQNTSNWNVKAFIRYL